MCVSFQVATHAEAAEKASLIFVCVHREHYEFLKTLAPHLQGKVCVESLTWRNVNEFTPELWRVERQTVVCSFLLREGTVVLQIGYLVWLVLV